MSKVLTATDKATKAFGTAQTSLKAAIEAAQAELPLILNQIEEKQSDLNALETQTKEKVRLAKVELDIQVKENEAAVLATLMKKAGYAVITTTELATLQTGLKTAEAFNQEEITKAVKIAEARKDTEHKAVLAEVTSEHRVASAKATADLEAANNKIGFLETQVAQLQDTITAERVARVDEAKARASAAGVVVNNGK